MIKNYKQNQVFTSKKQLRLNLRKLVKTTVLAISAVFISSLSYGQCITGGNSTETVAYINNVTSSANAVDADITGSAAHLNVPIAFGSATIAINFSKPVNPGDSIHVILGQAAGLNISLFSSFSATAYTGLATSSDPSVGTNVSTTSGGGLLSLLFIGGVPYQTLTLAVDQNATSGASSVAITASAFISLNYTVDVYGVTVVPGPPIGVDQTVCFPGGTETLQAQKYTLTGSTIDVQWYKANDTLPANLLQTDHTKSGSPYTSNYTTTVTSTKSFYVRQSTAGCGLYSALEPVTVTVLPAATPALVSNTSLNLITCGADGTGYISFVDPANLTKKYMAINPNGNIGYNFTSATAIENTLSTVAFNALSSTAIGQRLYTVIDGGTPPYTINGGMKVRIYYLPTDTTFARSIVHTITGGVLSNSWFKVPGIASTLTSLLTATGITNAIGLNSVATYGTEGTQKYVEFSGIKSFSTFGFAAAKGSSVILPISGMTLTGSVISGIPQLSWTTLTEVNSSYFNIESSTDGSTFTAIGKVAAAENSNSVLSYYFTDRVANNGIIYYRLKEVDKDGTATYSNTIAINLGTIATTFKVFPNPVSNLLNIQTTVDGTYLVELYSIDSKKVQTAQLTTGGGLMTLNINKTNVPTGVYSVKVTNINGKSASSYSTVLIK